MFKNILYENKVDKEISSSSEINKVTASNMNEIKEVVNNNSRYTQDEIKRLDLKINNSLSSEKSQFGVYEKRMEDLKILDGVEIDSSLNKIKIPTKHLLNDWDQTNLAMLYDTHFNSNPEYFISEMIRIYSKYTWTWTSQDPSSFYSTTSFTLKFFIEPATLSLNYINENKEVGKINILSILYPSFNPLEPNTTFIFQTSPEHEFPFTFYDTLTLNIIYKYDGSEKGGE